MLVANPIYDIVFKYLMEDERIARTILSALLKKDVISVVVRPHEYTGVQYSNPKNMVDGHALPTVAVYLLGHKVGDIEEPVLYVHHRSYDYNGNIVTKGLPNAFVDSLTHDSIIVQIPRLHGQINNRLDMVLSIFDQSRKDEYDEHVLRLDEQVYASDRDMEHILHRLTMAAADADMRHNMNVEDEYFSVIEKRDTEILLKDKQIAEKNVQLAEKNVQLAEKEVQLKEKDDKLKEKDDKLKEKDDLLRSTIALLLQGGMSVEEIAVKLNLDSETVHHLMTN